MRLCNERTDFSSDGEGVNRAKNEFLFALARPSVSISVIVNVRAGQGMTCPRN